MIKALLWDIDGTILNFLAAENSAIKKCFEIFNLGTCTDEMIEDYSVINKKYWEALERGEMTKEQILVGRFAEFFGSINVDSSVAANFNAEYQVRLGDTIVFYDNAKKVLDNYKGKLVQCAVTNGTKVAQERKLKNSGLDQIFDYIFISDDIGVEKPNKGFFDIIFKKLDGISPDEMLIIGDSLTSDIKGGNNAGIKTCLFNPYHKRFDTDVHIDYEINDLIEILSIVNQ